MRLQYTPMVGLNADGSSRLCAAAGVLTKVQAVRAYVQGFKSFRMPRMSNVWSTN
jgi:hypothetical protein